VLGHFQTRYPVVRHEHGWMIKGPTETCQIELLFRHASLEEEEWDFRGPITRLKYKNFYDPVHSIQPILFSFNDDPVAFRSNPDGFMIEVGGKVHEFRLDDGNLVYHKVQWSAFASGFPGSK
jgi:hypothetical protein